MMALRRCGVSRRGDLWQLDALRGGGGSGCLQHRSLRAVDKRRPQEAYGHEHRRLSNGADRGGGEPALVLVWWYAQHAREARRTADGIGRPAQSLRIALAPRRGFAGGVELPCRQGAAHFLVRRTAANLELGEAIGEHAKLAQN